MYVELDLNFLGTVVQNIGILITQELSEPLDEHHKTKLPGIISWNQIKLAYQVFVQKYGLLSLKHFNCLMGIGPLIFTALCIPSHKTGGIQLDIVTLNTI